MVWKTCYFIIIIIIKSLSDIMQGTTYGEDNVTNK